MNISNNQRYQSTEEKIQKALFSLLRIRKYDDISIKEICYEAGINRSSFYAHYLDINDLMIKTEHRLSKNIQQIFKPNTIWNNEVFTKLFEFLYENKDFYKAYLTTSKEVFMEKNDFVEYIKLINTTNTNMHIPQDQIVYHMAFFAGGLKAICKTWISTGCKESPAQMANIINDEYKLNTKFNL